MENIASWRQILSPYWLHK